MARSVANCGPSSWILGCTRRTPYQCRFNAWEHQGCPRTQLTPRILADKTLDTASRFIRYLSAGRSIIA